MLEPGSSNCDQGLPLKCLRLGLLSDPVKKLEHRHPKCVGDNLDCIQCRVSLTVFKTTQVRLVEAALFPENDLAEPGLKP